MKKFFFAFMAAIFPLFGLMAQIDLKQPIPTDPEVRIGKLDNGLVYYLRYNKMPANRMEMRLAVNAGSILEDEDQQGLAHFVEHMAFNGTENFSKSELIDFLEKVGVRFGPDLNAYTSFDETVYMLQLPTDRQGLIDSAFMVLEDWAHLLSLEGEEIDKERGVIREEWRLGLGADDRMRKKYFPVIFNGSLYADRLPIGTLGVIDTASYDALRSFYHDWYRPNLQAVIVVGDMDMDLAEAKIKQHFGQIQNPENERTREKFSIPGNVDPLVAIVTDKEATSTNLMLFYKHPKQASKTVEDYQRNLTQSLYTSMIISRLQEFNKKPESPFIYAYSYYGGFLGRAGDAYTSSAGVKENRINDAIAALVRENERVRQHGFTAQELERQKIQLISRMERQAKEQDKTNSASFVREYTNHFLTEAPIPSVTQQLELAKEIMPMIQLEAINALSSKWITDENMVVVITAPDREEIVLPKEDEVIRIIQDTKSEVVDPWEDSFTDQALFNKQLVEKEIVSQNEIPELGIHELVLENGIKVVIKPTDYKNDEILMTAFGPGGSSIFEDEQAFAANNITSVVGASGIGDFSSTNLDKKLTGQIVSVRPFVEEVRQGFRGSVSPKDFETMLQLISLHFDGARRDQEAFDAFKSQMSNQFKFAKANPRMIFTDTLVKLASGNSKRTVVIPTDAQMESLQAAEVYTMFDQLFETASDYTFIFTGNFDKQTMLPLVSKYLGNLPTEKTAKSWVNRKSDFPDGITDVPVYAGTENQSLVGIRLRNNFEWTDHDRLHLSLLMRAYNIKLRENMREEIGGVYGVGARASTTQFPESKLDISISWGTNPGLVDTLSTVVFQEMQKLIDNGPTEEDLAKIKETSIRERETNDRQNNFWNSYLDQQYFNQGKLYSYDDFRALTEAVTIEDLKETAKKYFNPEHYLRVVLYPEQE